MQGLTHLAAGMILTIVVWRLLPPGRSSTAVLERASFTAGTRTLDALHFTRVSLLFAAGILLHYVFDDLARFTYHPHGSLADWGDPVFAAWTLGNIAVVTPLVLVLVLKHDRRYLWAMFGSIVIDLWDWGFIKLVNAVAGTIIFPDAIIHSAPRPVEQLLTGAPDFRNFQWAIWVEVVIMAALLVGWLAARARWPLPPKSRLCILPSIGLAVLAGIVTCTCASLLLLPVYPWW